MEIRPLEIKDFNAITSFNEQEKQKKRTSTKYENSG